MSAAAAKAAPAGGEGAPAKGGRRKLVLLALPLLLALAGAGLWFGGILPPLLGMGPKADAGADPVDPHAPARPPPQAAKPDAHGAKPDPHGARPDPHAPAAKPDPHGAKPDPHAAKSAATPAQASLGPNFMELPEVIANLNAGPRRATYVKLKPRLELARAEDEPAVRAAVPRLLDLFQTYLREMRPEELRGSAGTYRLREELIARANIAVAPVRIVDVLLSEMLIQ